MDITSFVTAQRDAALLIGDYNTYREKLSRRILTIRKRLGRTTPKSGKYTTKAPITAENIGSNHEYLHLLLLTAERAWANAMQMKSAHAEENAEKGITGSTRSHIISRLNKAARIAKELVVLLQDKGASRATDIDILEGQAYAYSLSGSEEFEKQSEGVRSRNAQVQTKKWEPCLKYFAVARIIYNSLLLHTKKDVFKEVIVGTTDPSIRYGAYQAHLPRTVAVSTVAKQFFPKENVELVKAVEDLDPSALSSDKETTSTKGTTVESIPNTITWRSRTANIADAAIGQALASVEVAEAKLSSFLTSADPSTTSKERAAAYDDILIASQDAADGTRHAIEELEKEGINEGDPRMQDLRVTSLAVNYAQISWRVGRNRVLIGEDDGADLKGERPRKPKRPRKDGKEWVEKEEGNGRKLARLRERVVLYDAILQSIDSIKELRGAVRDEAFVRELDGKRAYFQALKCLNIAYSHALLSSPTNALALLSRSHTLATNASDLLRSSSPASTSTPPRLDLSSTSVSSLQDRLTRLLYQYRGIVTLSLPTKTTTTSSTPAATAPLVENLMAYPEPGKLVDLKNLVQYPPKLQPVMVKPLFFDVAWNYIEYPGRSTRGKAGVQEEKEEESEERRETPKKKGWFGFGR
ncbi:signal recognition particle protein [Patellaria atrata CBS 101060]|uniref:Signal recognition particle subunit SRP68 n=1 Tax=Patellaria atrata CBS 101060 TaxID=1346257 RepID=A0A9P4S7G0_9PEZI|nr:signal recognition particle protein [Patellaria atrata CBS 101060]